MCFLEKVSIMVREIFNDVLGPVMRGPSSSHTAGPARIGKWMSGLIGEVANVTFEISKSGSYASMFHSQGSDRGFLGGLLGYEPDAEELIAIPQILRQRKVDYSVILLEQAFAHPNFARITARDRRGCVAVTESTSIGGGAIRIHSVNHRETEITGTFYELLIFTQSPEECRLPYFEGIMQITKGPGLVNAKLVCKPPQAWLDRVRDSFPETYLIAPVLPCTIICQNDDDIPFSTGDTMLAEYAHTPLSEAALVYECTATGKGRSDILAMASSIFDTMERSAKNGFEVSSQHFAITSPVAGIVKNNSSPLGVGVVGDASMYAISSMENNIALGRIVAAPTAGSCGVLPGVLVALKQHLKLSPKACARAVLTAGICGLFISNLASFAAEECGCQAEIGAAASMAAAAAAEVSGATSDIALTAAALVMQSYLGLICDPVSGAVEVPCIIRNATAAASAIAAADVAIKGMGSVVGFDETMRTMYRVGRMLPPELRCTGKGGLAVARLQGTL